MLIQTLIPNCSFSTLAWESQETFSPATQNFDYVLFLSLKSYFGSFSCVYTVKTGVSSRHSLRHRNSASASVVSTLKSVCLSGKTKLISVKTTLISVKTTLRLSYRVLEMTLWVSFWYFWVWFNFGT
jgi:hypothetical protein